MEKIKSIFKTAGTKNGTYRVGLTALVIGIIVVLNLIFAMLPMKYRSVDVSSTKIYDISDTTKEFLEELKYNVTFTVLAQKENTDERIVTLLSKYDGLSDKIEVKWIDPVLHPSKVAEYNSQENTIVAECEETGRSTQISFSDIIVLDTSSYFYTGSVQESEFDGEGQLTSAVNYVSTDITKNIYFLTGHGEQPLSDTVSNLIMKNNYRTEELNLLMAAEVPEDTDLLLLYAPAKDLEESELETVRTYLSMGKDMMIILGDVPMESMPNLASLMEEYGLKPVPGYIADPSRSYQGNPYFIFPELQVNGKLSNNIVSGMVLLADAKGMEVTTPQRDTITTTGFMSTSDMALAVDGEDKTKGEYVLGAEAVEDLAPEAEGEEVKQSHITVVSAGSLIDPRITDSFTGLENTTLFMNALSSHFDDVKGISIEPKSLLIEYNAVRYPGAFSLLVIFGIPAAILIIGFSIWYKRRKA